MLISLSKVWSEVVAKMSRVNVNACDIIVNLSYLVSDIFSVLTKDCSDVEILL